MTIAMAASMLAGCGGTVVEEAPPSEAAQSSAAASTAQNTRIALLFLISFPLPL